MQLRVIKLISIFAVFSHLVYGQDFCGTRSSGSYLSYTIPDSVAIGNYYGYYDYYVIPIKFKIVGPEPCSSDDSVLDLIDYVIPNIILPELHSQFEEHRICFVNTGIDTICNDSLFNTWYLTYDIHIHSRIIGIDRNVFNIYIVPMLYKEILKPNNKKDTTYPSGVSPGSNVFPPYIFLKRAALFKDIKVTSHEIGHSFGLEHTHNHLCSGSDKIYWDKIEWAWTDNFDVQQRFNVSGGECATRGDGVCDTWPAIFTHKQIDWLTCKWKDSDSVCNPLQQFLTLSTIRNFVDTIWLLQKLDTSCTPQLLCNTMGYVPGIYCRKGFTKGQGARMRWHLDNRAVGRILHTMPSSLPTRVISGITYQSGHQASKYYLGRLSAKNILINPGASVEYSAAYSVVLKPPFHVKSGAQFHAFIEKKCTTRNNTTARTTNPPRTKEILIYQQHENNNLTIEVFPTVVTAHSSITIRFTTTDQKETVSLFWLFSDGSIHTIMENVPIQGSTLYINAPPSSGLYRLVITTQANNGQYQINNIPIVVY